MSHAVFECQEDSKDHLIVFKTCQSVNCIQFQIELSEDTKDPYILLSPEQCEELAQVLITKAKEQRRANVIDMVKS